MIGKEHNGFVRWGINGLVLLMMLGIGIYVWNVRLGLREAAIQQQHRTNKAILASQRHSDHKLCMQINGVKLALRSQENESYGHLKRNLRLLHIPLIPSTLKIAKRDHYERLSHLKLTRC